MLILTVAIIVIINVFLIVLIRHQAEKKIKEERNQSKKNEQFFQSLYKKNPDIILTFDTDGKLLNTNKIAEFYGYIEEELLQQSVVSYIVPDQIDTTLENFHIALNGESTSFDTAIFSKDGERYELFVTYIPTIVSARVIGVFAILKDITANKKAKYALTEAEEKYRNLSENSLVGIYITQAGKFNYANPKLLEMLGYEENELYAVNVMDCIHPDDHQIVMENIKKRIVSDSAAVQYQYRMVKKDKTILYVQNYGSTMMYKGEIAAIGAILDVTDQKQAQATIEYMAYHDALTGLTNRRFFYNQLKAILDQDTTKRLAVIFFDLDRFKIINDSMGHNVGDQLLQQIAVRLTEEIGDLGELSRNGGDEFLFSLVNEKKEKVSMVAEKILHCFTKPFYIDQYELYTTPSIGISTFPQDGNDVDALIKKADSAMYKAKRNGTNNFQYYFSDQDEHAYEKFEVDMDLHKALEQQEFHLSYQPKLHLITGEVVGAEALLRWNHPEKGIISPGSFIPRAEETGLIIPIGEWVLRTACIQTKYWQDAGLPAFVMSVNLSIRQIYQPDLVEAVKEILEDTGLEAKYLELEITESMMADSGHVMNVLSNLKNLGVSISLDDFGTGFSSLHYLKESPIDKLKIDQSFIRNCTIDANDATIVKTIIAMSHQLQLEVIAEGVETRDQLIFLQQNACDVSQGYLFSKPMPPDEFEKQYDEMGRIVERYGIPKSLQNRQWLEKSLQSERQELLDTLKRQHGMTYKFIKEDDKFIHTLCDGELVYKLGLSPEQIIGYELKDFQPVEEADRKAQYYQRAWEGEKNVYYEAELNGIRYVASMNPVVKGGRVVEVIASCLNITKWAQDETSLRQPQSNL
ncbi:sensor domain-containing protein [Virgibacillus flavescens]|uniref:sensor domain-containing protein n=1 Tax=Virgibacillus flavescens TaxID=1611422 RepID=UPI003D338272